MKRLCVLLCLVFSIATASARCGYCNGKGRVKTHIGVSGFGIDNSKYQCQYCKKWLYRSEDHWDICPQCHGNPDAGDDRHSDRDTDSGSVDVYLKYLTSAEYQDWQQCIVFSMQGGTKLVDCHMCQGDGKCKVCNGTGMSPIQNPTDLEILGMPTPCPNCGNTGYCQTCCGNGQVSVPDESIKELANKRLEYYRDLVNERMAAETHGSSNRQSGSYDGNVSGASSEDFYDSPSVSDNNKDDDYVSNSSSGKSKFVKYLMLFAVILGGAIIFLKARRK